MNTTLTEIFYDRTSPEFSSKPWLMYKSSSKAYRTMTNGEFRDAVERFTSGLISLGLERGDRIAILSESRPEWIITDHSSLLLGLITVPLYATLTPKHIEHILSHSGAKAIVVSNDVQLSKVLKCIDVCPSLQYIIMMNNEWQHTHQRIVIRSFHDVSAIGVSDKISSLPKPDPDDVITIIYTSGTTGTPKGVMLTHRNIISNMTGITEIIPAVGETDRLLSFLPLSHIFERMVSYIVFSLGAVLAFAESIDTVAENMLEVKPTIVTGVPRFYEKVCSRIMQSRLKMSAIKGKLFDWALEIGADCATVIEGGTPKRSSLLLRPIADALVLRKVRARTGGSIRFFVSGGAALPADVGRRFASFGLVVLEGYGLTETSPVIAITPSSLIKWGSVGKILPNIEVKITDNGEIITRGDHVMKGYFNEPELTAEVIDADGWLHTGDVGEIDSDGYLRITDRIKHIFVSEGGKNIAPGPIEQLLGSSRFVEQIMLIGDKRIFCSALIVPNFDEIRSELPETESLSNQEIVSRDDVHTIIFDDINRLQKDLASYERARRIALIAEPFTIENGLLTPTMKIKRKEVEYRYKDIIETMYRSME